MVVEKEANFPVACKAKRSGLATLERVWIFPGQKLPRGIWKEIKAQHN